MGQGARDFCLQSRPRRARAYRRFEVGGAGRGGAAALLRRSLVEWEGPSQGATSRGLQDFGQRGQGVGSGSGEPPPGTQHTARLRLLEAPAIPSKPIWKRADPRVSSLSLAADGTLFLVGTQFLYALRD